MTDNENNNSEITDDAVYVPPRGVEHYGSIETALGYTFKNKAYLDRALTHRSMPGTNLRGDYERLEFLGDAVLDLAIADLLLSIHETANEGELSKMRAALVNTQSLANIAEEIDLSPYIRLSRGELAQGGAKKPSILADVFEATIGAVYREAGFEPAKLCVSKVFGEKLRTVAPRDPKTELQETLHLRQMPIAEYLLECVEGPEHAPNFVSIVKIDNIIYGRGKGGSKKASQQEAAAEALQKILSAETAK